MSCSQQDSRDDANLRQFYSRSQQPKVIAAGAKVARGDITPVPVQVFIAFDQGFGRDMDQIDDTRFRYVGSDRISYNSGGSKRVGQACMADGMRNGRF